MRTGLISGFIVAFVLMVNFGSLVSLADSSVYHIVGRVTDGINGTNGVPGANVTLMSNVSMGNNGVKAATITDNPTTTSSDSADIGYFEFSVSQPGTYQVYAEKSGLNGSLTGSYGQSALFTVSQGITNYTVQVVLMLSMPSVSPTVTITPTTTPVPVTITPSPTAMATPAPTAVPTPTPLGKAATLNPITPTPVSSTETHPMPAGSSTPVPTPGISLTLIPTIIIISIVALKKYD